MDKLASPDTRMDKIVVKPKRLWEYEVEQMAFPKFIQNSRLCENTEMLFLWLDLVYVSCSSSGLVAEFEVDY